ARDRLVDAGPRAVEALDRALAEDERTVALVDVGRDEIRRVRVGARDEHRRHAEHVGRERCRRELADRLRGRHQHLAAHVTALLGRRELVFEVHARSTGAYHVLHQLERVQVAAEAGLGVRHDGREPVDAVVAGERVDLVRAYQRVVDALHHLRHGIGGIQALVRVHLTGAVAVAGDLPAGAVDGLEPGLHFLDRLVAGQRPERAYRAVAVEQPPELLRTAAGKRVLDADRAAQADDVGGTVIPPDAPPAG